MGSAARPAISSKIIGRRRGAHRASWRASSAYLTNSVETCIAHCDVAARDLLPYGDVVIVPSTVLRIRRRLNGAEIDELISRPERRWRPSIGGAPIAKIELSARSFRAEIRSRP